MPSRDDVNGWEPGWWAEKTGGMAGFERHRLHKAADGQGRQRAACGATASEGWAKTEVRFGFECQACRAATS